MRQTVEAEFRATAVFETAVAQAAQKTLVAQPTNTPPPAPPTATPVPPTQTPLPTHTAVPGPTPTPLPTATPVASDRVTEIHVHTHTGAGGSGTCFGGLSIDGGGTDSTVTFWVNTNTKAHPFNLDDPADDNDREEDDYNMYTLQPSEPISMADVVAIAIEKDDGGHCPDWLLREVTVVFDLEDGSQVKLWFLGNCMQDTENSLPMWLQKGKLMLFWPLENWCYQDV
jgi:hypothetical protein